MVLRAGIEQGGHDNNPNDLCCNCDPAITNDMPLRGINVIFCFCSLRSLALSHPSIFNCFKVVLRAGIEQGGCDNDPNDLGSSSDPVITNDMPLHGIKRDFLFLLATLASTEPPKHF